MNSTPPTPTVLRVPAHGMTLNALDWNPAGETPILCLHGWMDHARGFDWMIQALPRTRRAVALDFRGHGESDHLAPGAHYQMPSYAVDVECTLDALGWAKAHLVGHSMGGAVALIFAAARPERVLSLTLIENLGTPGLPEEAVRRLRMFMDDARKPPRKRTYATLEDAVARVRENNPGLTPEAALHLTRYGTRAAEGGLQFTFDPRLRGRLGMGFSEEQVQDVLKAIACPVQVLYGTNGYRMPEEVMARRLELLRSPLLIPVEGGHHVHMDRPAEVAGHLERFLASAAR